MGAFVLLFFLLAGSAAAGSASTAPGNRQHSCQVGGPPAWHYSRLGPGVKRLSPVVTIACGHRLAGPYEIVAADTDDGLLVYAEGATFGEGQNIRDPELPDFPEQDVTVLTGWGGPPARSHVSGVLGAEVARVEVIFYHRGQRRRLIRTPVTAHVTGALLSELHQTEPFGAYAITLPGCVPPKGLRVVAFDASGGEIGVAAPIADPTSHPCNPKTWFRRH